MAAILIAAASAAVMLAATLAAIRLANITTRRLFWGAIASAFFLMAVYRTLMLERLIADPAADPLLVVDILGLLTAILLLGGTLWLGPLLRGLQQSHQDLSLSERRYRTIMQQSPLSIAIFAPDGKLVLVNPAFQRLWRLSDERLLEVLRDYNVLEDASLSGKPEYAAVLDAFTGGPESSAEETHMPDGRSLLRQVSRVTDEHGALREVVVVHQDMTPIKEAERALAQKQAQLATLLSNLPGMAYRCKNDPQWTMEFVSNGSTDLTGYPPAALIQNRERSYNDIILPEDRAFVWNQVQLALEDRKPFQVTYRILTANGAIRWVWEQGRGQFDGHGELLAIDGFITDISTQRNVEQQLRDSEQRFRAVLENNLDLLYRLDLTNSRYDYISPAALTVTGFTAAELQSMGPAGITQQIHPDDRVMVRAHFRQLRDRPEKAASRLTYRWLDKAGRWRWLSETRSLTRKTGGALEALIGSSRDVTDRIEAEREIMRTRAFLQNVIDSMPSIIVGIDTAGLVTLWNRRAEEESGVNSEGALRREFELVLPLLLPHAARIHEALEKGSPLDPIRFHPDAPEKKGRTYDLMAYPLSQFSARGAVIRVDDVTSRAQFEEMMIQTEKMMSVGGLAAGMAHEINNPLGGILQACQNIERRTLPNLPKNEEVAHELGTSMNTIAAYLEAREVYEFLKGIRSDGARAARIVHDMLTYSRKSGSRLAPVDLREIIETALRLAGNDYDLRRHYDFKRLEIVENLDPALHEIRCEKIKIEQVLLNLVKNAAQAVALTAAERKPRIEIRTRREGLFACIDVIDNGPGIDEATQRRIFEPFFTTKEVGEGTGLGLSVSYFIVTNQHTGNLLVTSLPGQGTTFTVRLPIDGPLAPPKS